MDSHYRKHPVNGVKLIPGEPMIVFVTVCSKDRTPWMACPEVHALLCDVLRSALLGKQADMY